MRRNLPVTPDVTELRGESCGNPNLREAEPLPLLQLEGISKSYRDPMTLKLTTVVRGVSLALCRGEIFGLLGPNGAGKTTTIKMIVGLARPSLGRVLLSGRDPDDPAARMKLGYLSENPCFYDHLTALEYMELVGTLFGLKRGGLRRRSELLLERLGLTPHAKKPLRRFSKGMTQRLGLAQALVNEPALLVLDEPMSGLDPIGRAEVKQLLREERERGTTILMSSHVLAETESICDRVAILESGRLLEVGTIRGLLSTGIREWEVSADSLPGAEAARFRDRGHRVDSVGSRSVIRVARADDLQCLLRELTQQGVPVHSVEPRRETLEEHFVRTLSANGGSGT